jgi:hypothetical protein
MSGQFWLKVFLGEEMLDINEWFASSDDFILFELFDY